MKVKLLRKLRKTANDSFFIEMVTKKGGVRYYSIRDNRGSEVVCSYTLEGAKMLLFKERRNEFERMCYNALTSREKTKRMRY